MIEWAKENKMLAAIGCIIVVSVLWQLFAG
jgi:type II secretory pathway component PulM